MAGKRGNAAKRREVQPTNSKCARGSNIEIFPTALPGPIRPTITPYTHPFLVCALRSDQHEFPGDE